MSDTGEDAIRRETAEAVAYEAERERLFGRLDDRDERTVIERTDAEQSAFAAKMAEWRRTGSIPSYTGPKATR